MADVINLREARKRRRRVAVEAEAAQNRVRHGRSAADKARLGLSRDLDGKRLDAHRRDDPDGPDRPD